MKTKNELYIMAEIYSERINDAQAKIIELELNEPSCITDRIKQLKKELSYARTQSRVFVDEEHFKKWDELLSDTEAAIIRSKLFK